MATNHTDVYREASDLLRRGDAAAAVSRLESFLAENPGDEVGLSMLGSSLTRAGNTDKALQAFGDNVELHPDSYAAHGDLGFARMQIGDSAGAIDSFEKALNLKPDFYPAHCFLSRLLYSAGRIDDAKAALKTSEQNDPFSAEFRNIQSAMSADRFAEAEKIARSILSRQPGHPKAAYTLAHLATTVGAFEAAADILRRSIENYPCDINLRAALVNSLEETGHYEQALEEAAHIVELDPTSYAPFLIVGRIHGHCGHYEESLTAFEQALGLTEDDENETGNIELLRGHVLKILGQHNDGISAYRRSIDLVENNGAGWWGLADMKTFRFTEDDHEAMVAIAENENVKPEQRTQAAFALGKAMEDSGNHANAFSWYVKANALRTGIKFDPKVNSEGIDELIRVFTPGLLQSGNKEPVEGPSPIFICGLPRSGSTLVEQILATHSQIEGTMELVNLPNIVRQVTIDGGKRKESYPASLAGFTLEMLAAYGREYIDTTAIYRTDKPYFIDKLPTNFDKIGLIHMVLPNAIIIDARRHPMDCGFSCFKQHFAGGHHFSYKLEHIGSYYNDYLRLMDHWHKVLPGRVLTVQYEDMVADAEAMTRTLLEHCGVPFEDACLRFFENKRPVRTASSEQVRQPIYKKAVQYWKNFEDGLEPLSKSLGPETLARFDAQ